MSNQIMAIMQESNLLVQSELLRILTRMLEGQRRQQCEEVRTFVTLDNLKVVMNLMRSRNTIKGALPVFTVSASIWWNCVISLHRYLSNLRMRGFNGCLLKNRDKLIKLIDEHGEGFEGRMEVVQRLRSLKSSTLKKVNDLGC